jgi:hypothetical protein
MSLEGHGLQLDKAKSQMVPIIVVFETVQG